MRRVALFAVSKIPTHGENVASARYAFLDPSILILHLLQRLADSQLDNFVGVLDRTYNVIIFTNLGHKGRHNIVVDHTHQIMQEERAFEQFISSQTIHHTLISFPTFLW
jgi:hypothetical protein